MIIIIKLLRNYQKPMINLKNVNNKKQIVFDTIRNLLDYYDKNLKKGVIDCFLKIHIILLKN